MRHRGPLSRPGEPAVEFGNLLRIGFPLVAVKRRKFGDRLWNCDAEFGGSRLEHVGGLLVSGSAPSFDTCLPQNAVAQPTGVLLRMDGDPDFLAGRRMFQQHVASFPRPHLHESRSLQLPDPPVPGLPARSGSAKT